MPLSFPYALAVVERTPSAVFRRCFKLITLVRFAFANPSSEWHPQHLPRLTTLKFDEPTPLAPLIAYVKAAKAHCADFRSLELTLTADLRREDVRELGAARNEISSGLHDLTITATVPEVAQWWRKWAASHPGLNWKLKYEHASDKLREWRGVTYP